MQTNLTTKYLGLDESKTKAIASELNQLLADYHVVYQNLRAAHWNIKGEMFFTLHNKFEELYNESKLNVDEVAERILSIGFVPVHRMRDLLNTSNIDEMETVGEAKEVVTTLLTNFSALLTQERKVLKLAADAGDEATVDQMTQYIASQEKTCWMLSAFLK